MSPLDLAHSYSTAFNEFISKTEDVKRHVILLSYSVFFRMQWKSVIGETVYLAQQPCVHIVYCLFVSVLPILICLLVSF